MDSKHGFLKPIYPWSLQHKECELFPFPIIELFRGSDLLALCARSRHHSSDFFKFVIKTKYDSMNRN